MLINFSNHPSKLWSHKQLQAAGKYGEILDIAFPEIAPTLTKEEIRSLVNEYYQEIMCYSNTDKIVVHIMGEMTFCFSLIEKLKQNNITCIASTSQRIIENITNNRKEILFEFCTFRDY